MRSQSALNLPPVVPLPESVNGNTLLHEIRQLLSLFVVLPMWAAEILTLWIVHTYAYELRQVATYIGIESPKERCGKTTLMTLLSELVDRPEPAANISSPALYRALEELRPTLLIDEADNLLPGNPQLRGILNSGYTRKMAYVLRVTNDPLAPQIGEAVEFTKRRTRLARYSCFGPKAIAQIGRLPKTLGDRCIVMRMQRKMESEARKRLIDLDKAVLERLRRQCARFVLDHRAAIASARPAIPWILNDRAADLSEPLLAVADEAGGDWPALARQAMVGLIGSAEENDPIGALLLDIRGVFQKIGGGRLFSRTLVGALNDLGDRPWAELRMGLNVSEAWLAKQLQPFGIRPRNIRMSGRVGRGYFESDFKEAFQRYVPRSAAGPEDGGLKAEVSGQRSEDRGLKAADGRLKADDGGQGSEGGEEKQKTEVRDQRSEGEEKKPDANEQRPGIESQKKDETGEAPGSEAAAA